MSADEVRRIVLCADDYGLSPGVSRAIRDLVARGRINATSAMVVAPSLDRSEAAALAVLKDAAPRLQIGLHFTLTAPFRPVSDAYPLAGRDTFMTLPATLGSALIARLDRARIADELRAQIAAFTGLFGFAPDYVDGHQHVQIFPQVRDAVLAVTREMLPDAWMRQCGRVTPLAARVTDRKGMLLDVMSAGISQARGGRGRCAQSCLRGRLRFRLQSRFRRTVSEIPRRSAGWQRRHVPSRVSSMTNSRRWIR